MKTLALPEGNLGRLLAAGLLVLLLLGFWMVVVLPLVSFYQERAADLQARRALVIHMTALAASLPKLQATAGSEHMHLVRGPSHLDGATDALAAAELQTIVGQIAGTSGVEISSIETAMAQNTVWGRRIGVSIRATANYRSLTGFIVGLETTQPKIIVDDLEIHNASGSSATVDTAFDCSLTVYGFRGPGGGS